MFSTGDEIVEPGAPRRAAALFDANRYLLAACSSGLGARSPISASCPTIRDGSRARSRRRRAATIWC